MPPIMVSIAIFTTYLPKENEMNYMLAVSIGFGVIVAGSTFMGWIAWNRWFDQE